MIDEKKLIEVLEDYKNNEWNKNLYLLLSTIVDDCIDFVENQPKIGEWIPCSERLPENISTVIVQISEIQKPTFGWYASINKKWILSEKDFVDLEKYTVVAWRPLPEPYKP